MYMLIYPRANLAAMMSSEARRLNAFISLTEMQYWYRYKYCS